MGLAITYTLKLNSATIEEAREKMMSLRNFALTFPFVEIESFVELAGKDCIADDNNRDNDVNYLLKLRAIRLDGATVKDGEPVFLTTDPTYILAFNTLPGKGSSTALFGLALYSEIQEKNDWYWKNYCKTQSASNPDYGGVENFVRCHTFVIAILDEMQKLGISCKVSDGSNYWENRNLEELIRNVTDSNMIVAAVMGAFKNALGGQYTTQAPVLDYPNFEYLEAEGQNLIDNE